MIDSTNAKLIRRLFEHHLDHGDLDRLDEVFSSDFAPGFAGAQGQRGPVAFATPIRRLRAAFPDLRYTIDDLVAEGDRVAVRWTWHGTFTGEYTSALGNFAPNGKAIDSTGFGIFELAEGKVTRASLETDRLGLLIAIGALPDRPGLAAPPTR